MDKTAQYQLNQWAPSDRVLREDFNKDNQKLETALSTIRNEIPQIKIGTYVGTGLAGSEHKNSLTFDFKPRLVLILAPENPHYQFLILPDHNTGSCFVVGANQDSITVRWDHNTVSWWHYDRPYFQLNESGKTHYYFAI